MRVEFESPEIDAPEMRYVPEGVWCKTEDGVCCVDNGVVVLIRPTGRIDTYKGDIEHWLRTQVIEMLGSIVKAMEFTED